MQLYLYYDIIMWVLLVGALITVIEALVLLLLFRRTTWWDTRTNRMVLSLDIISGFGVIISAVFFLVGSWEVIYATSFFALTFLMILVFSHLWRMNQYLFKTGEKFVKNTAMFVLNVIKVILLLGGFLLSGSSGVYFS